MPTDSYGATQRLPRPDRGYWLNRLSLDTEAEREARFIAYIGPDAAGEIDARRALFMRRYQRPEPPEGMAPITSIHTYQKRGTTTYEETAIRSENTCPTDQADAA